MVVKEVVFGVYKDQLEHMQTVCQEALKDPTGEAAFKAMVEYQDFMMGILGFDPEKFDTTDVDAEEAEKCLGLMLELQEYARSLNRRMQPWVSELETQSFEKQGPHALVAWYRGHLARLDEIAQMEPGPERLDEFRGAILDFRSANNMIAERPTEFRQQLDSLDWQWTAAAIDTRIKALISIFSSDVLFSAKDLTPPS